MAILNFFLLSIPIFLGIIGIIICAQKINSNIIYKHGIWFFSLNILTRILDLLRNYAIVPLIVRKMGNSRGISIAIGLSTIPTLLIGIAAYVVLIIGFYRAYNDKSNQ